MIPIAVHPVLDTFPPTPNRKIDRNALPRPVTPSPPRTATYVEPRTDVERVVADIFAETLDLDRVGVDDNFFELGGHSLHATSILARSTPPSAWRSSCARFFVDPTVTATAAALTSDTGATQRIERVAELRVRLDVDVTRGGRRACSPPSERGRPRSRP